MYISPSSLIVRVRSRLCWRNLCFENSFILSFRISFVVDETSGLLSIQHCLVSVNESWVSPILSITHFAFGSSKASLIRTLRSTKSGGYILNAKPVIPEYI